MSCLILCVFFLAHSLFFVAIADVVIKSNKVEGGKGKKETGEEKKGGGGDNSVIVHARLKYSYHSYHI